MKKKKVVKACRRLKVKPPKVIAHAKQYDRKKIKKELKREINE